MHATLLEQPVDYISEAEHPAPALTSNAAADSEPPPSRLSTAGTYGSRIRRVPVCPHAARHAAQANLSVLAMAAKDKGRCFGRMQDLTLHHTLSHRRPAKSPLREHAVTAEPSDVSPRRAETTGVAVKNTALSIF